MTRKRPVRMTPAAPDRLLAVDRPPAQAVTLRKTVFRRVAIEALEIPTAPEVWIPGYLYEPKSGGSDRLILILDPSGRAHWQEDALYDRLASSGHAVCALDVRGVGDLAPEFGRGAARYNASHSTEQHYAWSSLILGKPLLGQRVTDILAAAHALRARPALAGKRVVLAARGILTAAAQFAAALDPAIGSLYLSGGLVSFRNVIETEEYLGGGYHSRGPVDLFGSFVPRLLLHTDLPDVTASIAPRRVVLAGVTDAAGKRMEVEAVRQVYARAGNVEIRANAAWDAKALASA
jgi:hypothetical protein